MKLYVIIPWSFVQDNYTLLNVSLARTFYQLRASKNGADRVLPIETPVPDIFLSYKLYTEEEIKEVLKGPAWTIPQT